VFSSEYAHPGQRACGMDGMRETVNCGAIKVPQRSEIMAYAAEKCSSKILGRITWDEIGPDLLGDAVRVFSLIGCVKAPVTFCPISSWAFGALLEPYNSARFATPTYAIHLWHELWRAYKIDVDASYHPTCIFEELKKIYLTATLNPR